MIFTKFIPALRRGQSRLTKLESQEWVVDHMTFFFVLCNSWSGMITDTLLNSDIHRMMRFITPMSSEWVLSKCIDKFTTHITTHQAHKKHHTIEQTRHRNYHVISSAKLPRRKCCIKHLQHLCGTDKIWLESHPLMTYHGDNDDRRRDLHYTSTTHTLQHYKPSLLQQQHLYVYSNMQCI